MKKLLVTAMFLVGIVGVFFFMWSRGSVSTTQQAPTNEVKGLTTGDTKVLSLSYFEVTVPARFQLKTNTQNPQKPLLLQQLYVARESATSVLFGDQMAITVGEQLDGGLDEVSDVKLRLRDHAYTRLPTNETGTYVFESRVSQYEVGVFRLFGGKYVGVVLTGPLAKQEQLKRELDALATTIRWQ